MVRGLILHLILILTRFECQSRAGKRAVQQNVDLIEGEPVFHQPVERLEAGARIAGEEIDHFAVAPRAILHDQMHRHVKMTQRNQRLDTVLLALLEQAAVKSDALRVGLAFVAARVEAAPGDRGAEHRKAHLRHQCDILFVAVIKIDRLMARIVFVFAQRKALF